MASRESCDRFIQAGEAFEKRLYLFALLLSGSRAAASEIMERTFVLCYRDDSAQGGSEALERDAFRTAFDLAGTVRRAGETLPGDAPPVPNPLRDHLLALRPMERAAVALTLLCRFSTSSAAAILCVPVEFVCAARLRALGIIPL